MMKKIISLLVVVATICGCQKFDEGEILEDNATQNSIVEVLEDGRLKIEVNLKGLDMDSVDVSTRAGLDYENAIYSGWCLVFGEDDDGQKDPEKNLYSDLSPLIQTVPVIVDSDGKFYITLDEYDDVAMIRFVANLTTRETTNIKSAKTWFDAIEENSELEEGAKPTNELVDQYGVATYSDYRLQSVGLDGIYNIEGGYNINITTSGSGDSYIYSGVNGNKPDPTKVASCFPMASYGFVLDNISAETVNNVLKKVIYMVRVCSKVVVNTGTTGFDLMEVYMIECAQEARIRSTVYASSGSTGTEINQVLSVPKDLGGCIDYLPLTVETGAKTSDPIYFYPNSGGDYDSTSGAVDKDDNPQYVIFKGRASGYDTNGYYKIALKAQYPLLYELDDDGYIVKDEDGNNIVTSVSTLTYDILRNTSFSINLKDVNKPGYKTYEDAADPNNPANNISYDIVMTTTNNDGRDEILVSNGTYYVDLECSYIFMKGYGTEGTYSSVTFTLKPNTSNDDYQFPTTYIMGDSCVEILACKVDDDNPIEPTGITDADIIADADENVADEWVVVESAKTDTEVTVYFKVTGSGRLRLRIGDMLKFVTVKYDSKMVGVKGVNAAGSEVDFGYFYVKDASDGTEKGTMSNTFTRPPGKTITLALDDNNYEYVSATDVTADNTFFTAAGQLRTNTSGEIKEFRAMFYPTNGYGITKLYFRQAYE